MVFHPNRHQYAYCVNEPEELLWIPRLKIRMVDRVRTKPRDMMPADFSDTRWAADNHITPDGRHSYARDRTASLIPLLSASEDRVRTEKVLKASSRRKPNRAALLSTIATRLLRVKTAIISRFMKLRAIRVADGKRRYAVGPWANVGCVRNAY